MKINKNYNTNKNINHGHDKVCDPDRDTGNISKFNF